MNLFTSYDAQREFEDEMMGFGEPAYYVAGVPCGSYEEACIVAGIETPAQLAAIEEWERLQWIVSTLRAPPYFDRCECQRAAEAAAAAESSEAWRAWMLSVGEDPDEIPF